MGNLISQLVGIFLFSIFLSSSLSLAQNSDTKPSPTDDKLSCPEGTTLKKETWEDLGYSESCYNKDGKKHGPSNIFMSSKKYSVENYKHGKLEGETVIYEESGKQSKYYKAGNLASEVLWYSNNNKKIEKIYGKNPKTPTVHYFHEDGTQASSNPDSEMAYWLNKLPAEARKYLDSKAAGWHLVDFSINRPPVISGDFNGDLKTDLLVLVKVGKVSKAIVLLASEKGYQDYDVTELKDETTSTVAVVHNTKNDDIRFAGNKVSLTYEFTGKAFSKLGD